ncbi:MAG TPA: tRNA lysidine(34) synthetase TilS, partial [Deinococcales bacterium]|nr:tRNA lysidine(34) synthetase TilS [Deinococcales bacterium]
MVEQLGDLPAGLLLAAVSGGADSTALARLLAEAGHEFHIATLDHALRPGSAADVEFVQALGEELGVPVHAERIDVRRIARDKGWNLEDAARRLRYSFLTRTARRIGADCILTAHTLDDQAETVLMQLLRGSAWLRGMPATRGRISRPLLGTARATLEKWLEERGHTWRDDPTNLDTRLLRAWLRHDVIPKLEARVADVRQQLARLAELQRDQEDQLRHEAEGVLRGDTQSGVDTTSLAQRHIAVQRQVIHQLLAEAGLPADYSRVERIRSKLDTSGTWRETVAPGQAVRVAYGRLSLTASGSGSPDDTEVHSAAQLPAGVKAEALELENLRLRGRRPGDRMTLSGGTKTLARLMIDRKIPREDRDSLQVLASGSTVIWAERLGAAHGWSTDTAPDADGRFMQLAL